MTDVVVVGGGMSGLACARRVADAGLSVQVLDRGRRLGGRLGARTFRDLPGGGEHAADTGGPYCTVSDEDFRQVVDGWVERGLARAWTDTFVTGGPDGLGEPKTGPVRFSGAAGMRALVEDLAEGLDVRSEQTVDADGVEQLREEARAVVLAMPGPQAARLLPPQLAAIADQPYDPSIAVVARFAERTWADFDAAFVSETAVRWLADDGRSRGDGAPVLVAHTTPDAARPLLDDPSSAGGPAVEAMRRILGIDVDPVETLVQRWTFAQPTEGRDDTFFLTDDGLGLCGDGWAEKSKVEAAWRSGTDLGEALAARLTRSARAESA